MRFAVSLSISLSVLVSCRETQRVQPTYYGSFREAPVTSIRASGWLKQALERQRDGLGLHRAESGYPYDTGLWACEIPNGGNSIAAFWWPYEQTGYMVDGLYRCGLFLGDSTLICLGRSNADYVLSRPRGNGMMGPEKLGENQWALSVFARALFAYYDESGDKRFLDGFQNHFAALPDSLFSRQACIIESMCKVYSYTLDTVILDAAKAIWDSFSLSEQDADCFAAEKMVGEAPVVTHGVTAAEVSKQPAILYLYTGDEKYLSQARGFYASIFRDHLLADGVPSSSERLSGNAPEALHETCDISDFLWSYGYMMMATGDPKWGDLMESALFNAAFGAVDKEFKSHQYFSSPNQLFATHSSSVAAFGKEGAIRQAFRPGFDTECCSGNVHRMIPNYVSRMWMYSPRDGGIAATLLGPSVFSTEIDGNRVTVTEDTAYPYADTVRFEFSLSRRSYFPFYLRIPSWAEDADIFVNGMEVTRPEAGSFYCLKRRFKNGDVVTLSLPMRPRKVFSAGESAVSFFLGPLLYALELEEDARMVVDGFKSSDDFPAWDIRPASPWNYAIPLDGEVIVERAFLPHHLRVIAYRVPDWTADGTTPPLPSPGFVTVPEPEEITLIPSGTTRIRLSVFPVKP